MTASPHWCYSLHSCTVCPYAHTHTQVHTLIHTCSPCSPAEAHPLLSPEKVLRRTASEWICSASFISNKELHWTCWGASGDGLKLPFWRDRRMHWGSLRRSRPAGFSPLQKNKDAHWMLQSETRHNKAAKWTQMLPADMEIWPESKKGSWLFCSPVYCTLAPQIPTHSHNCWSQGPLRNIVGNEGAQSSLNKTSTQENL